jgi:hypothetical protein
MQPTCERHQPKLLEFRIIGSAGDGDDSGSERLSTCCKNAAKVLWHVGRLDRQHRTRALILYKGLRLCRSNTVTRRGKDLLDLSDGERFVLGVREAFVRCDTAT